MIASSRKRSVRAARVAALFLTIVVFGFTRSGFFNSGPHRIFESDRFSVQPNHASTSAYREGSDQICRSYGWKPFASREGQRRRKVYDLFMVNTELDWLEIRLNSTFDHVDYFVAVEASKTFTGLDKPLFLKENWGMFASYHDKMIYHEVEYPEGYSPKSPWEMEDFVRNSMYTQVLPRLAGDQAPTEGDVIIVADVDEIPRPETLQILRSCRYPRRLTLRSRFYYYSFQFLHRGDEWAHPQATYYEGTRTLLPANLRVGDGGSAALWAFEKADLWNSAWHCSSCFATIDEFLTKMASFSHTSFNHDYFRNRDYIAQKVRSGEDIWNRETEVFDRLEGNTDVPGFLSDDPERFRYLLNRDGETAGFSDYPS